MNPIISTKVVKTCYRCEELLFFQEFLERNANFSEESVISNWKENDKQVLCERCLKKRFQRELNKLDRLLTPIAIAFLFLCIVGLIFFPFILQILDSIKKFVSTTEAQLIVTIIIMIFLISLYTCINYPFKEMFKKIR